MSSVPSSSTKVRNTDRRTAVRWMLAIVVASIVPYIDALRGGFVLDDWHLIVFSPIVRNLSIGQAFLTRFLPEAFGNDIVYYRPLVTLSYQANYAATGLNPFVLHLTNVLLSAVVAVTVYLLARRLGVSYTAAGVAGIAFSVLPSHAEAVAWISGRTDILSTIFMLGSLLVFVENHKRDNRFSWLLALLCSFLFACALLCKESSLTLPILMLGYVFIFGEWKRPKEAAKWLAVFTPPVVAYLALRNHVMGTALDTHLTYMLKERLLGVGVVYASYLRMLFVPKEVHVLYDIFTVVGRHPAIAILTWSIPLGLAVVAVLLRRRLPVVAFASFWILVTLLPVSNILPTFGPLPADRFVYLASVGSSILIGLFVSWIYQYRPKSVRVWPLVVVLLVGGYFLYSSALVIDGSRYYTSSLAWAKGVVATDTRFSMFRYAAAQCFEEVGMLEEATRQYKLALELDRGLLGNEVKSDAEYRLGLCYIQSGAIEDAAAAFSRAANTYPSNGKAWRNYGRIMLKLQHYPQAVKGYEQAFKHLKPKPRDYYELGLAYKAQGNIELARSQFKSAAHGDPDDKWAKEALKELNPNE